MTALEDRLVGLQEDLADAEWAITRAEEELDDAFFDRERITSEIAETEAQIKEEESL